MVTFKDFIRPTWLKGVLTFAFIVPCFLVITLSINSLRGISFFHNIQENVLLLVLLVIIVSAILASVIDTLVKNNVIKIAIASVSALLSIAIAYLLTRTMVCDPVHEPYICDPVHVPSECELACRKILDTAANQSQEIMNKFNECMQNCYK